MRGSTGLALWANAHSQMSTPAVERGTTIHKAIAGPITLAEARAMPREDVLIALRTMGWKVFT